MCCKDDFLCYWFLFLIIVGYLLVIEFDFDLKLNELNFIKIKLKHLFIARSFCL